MVANIMKYLTLSAFALFLLAACASSRQPIIDTQGVNMAQYENDLLECEAYADQINVAQRAGTGAVGGAVFWSIIGAIFGNSSTAQRAAGAGAVSGGASGTIDGVQEKRQIVRNCLRGRGYRVLN